MLYCTPHMQKASLWCEHAGKKNLLLQTSHMNGFSLVWTRMWLFKCDHWENVFLHTSQVNGYFLDWIFSSVSKDDFSKTSLLNKSQVKGFSLVWMHSFWITSGFGELLHISLASDFSLSWERDVALKLNLFFHVTHERRYRKYKCAFIIEIVVKLFFQKFQV